MNFKLYPKKVFISLLLLISALLFLNVMGLVSAHYFGHKSVYGLVPLFDFDTEGNIPTFYSSLALLFSSGLLSIIAITHKKNGSEYLSWLGLAVIFLFLSFDETVSIHERFGCSTTNRWVNVYGIALIIFIIFYLKFLIRLPKSIMILFVISGVTFVSGSIGFELLGGRHNALYGTNNLIYAIYYTIEEFLEMLGIAIFIYTLLTYIGNQFKSLTITVHEPK